MGKNELYNFPKDDKISKARKKDIDELKHLLGVVNKIENNLNTKKQVALSANTKVVDYPNGILISPGGKYSEKLKELCAMMREDYLTDIAILESGL